MSQGKSTGPREPARPRLSAATVPADSIDHDLRSEATFRGVSFEGIDLSGQSGDTMEFVQCRFRRVTLANAVLEHTVLIDCDIENSDWANVRATKSSLHRVETSLARLTGVHWIDGALVDVSFRECRMDLAVWRFTSFKRVAFVDCNLARADFTHADLRGAQFSGCDLTGAQFAHSLAEGARFSRCELAGIGSVAQLRGAVISGHDLATLAVTFANALGIVGRPGVDLL